MSASQCLVGDRISTHRPLPPSQRSLSTGRAPQRGQDEDDAVCGRGFCDGFGCVGVVDLVRVEIREGDLVEALRSWRGRASRTSASASLDRQPLQAELLPSSRAPAPMSDGPPEGGRGRAERRLTAPGPQTHPSVPSGAIGGRHGANNVSSNGRSLKMCDSQNAGRNERRGERGQPRAGGRPVSSTEHAPTAVKPPSVSTWSLIHAITSSRSVTVSGT